MGKFAEVQASSLQDWAKTFERLIPDEPHEARKEAGIVIDKDVRGTLVTHGDTVREPHEGVPLGTASRTQETRAHGSWTWQILGGGPIAGCSILAVHRQPPINESGVKGWAGCGCREEE
jgi:hypothetical protein